MLHPQDPHKRQRLFDTLEARCVVEGGQSEPASHKLMNPAVELAGRVDSNLVGDSAYGVAVTGDLLLLVINAAMYSPKDASLARVIRVWGEDQALGKTGGGHSVAASPRSIKAAWARFKTVAHLCGAWRLFLNGEITDSNPCDPDELTNFLAVAETLCILGEYHHPPSGRTGSKKYQASILNPEATWKIPDDLTLPTTTLDVPPPTEFTSRVFRDYRAE